MVKRCTFEGFWPLNASILAPMIAALNVFSALKTCLHGALPDV